MKKKLIISMFAYDQNHSGISRYINEIILELKKEYKLELLIPSSEVQYIPSQIIENTSQHIFRIPLNSKIIEILIHSIVLPIYCYLFLNKLPIFLPAANRRFFGFSFNPLYGTLHDLSQFHVKNKYDSLRMIYIKYLIPKFLSIFDVLFTPSLSTKKDILKYFNLASEKIIVNHNGLSNIINKKNSFKPREQNNNKQTWRLLYVSRLEWPGKNHQIILDAVKKLEDIEHSLNYEIVFAGKDWGGKKNIIDHVQKINLQSKVLFLEHLSDEELAQEYTLSDIFIHPSFYEGFGLPLLEAMSAGTICISSNKSSLPEIGGENLIYFSPNDPTELSLKIKKVTHVNFDALSYIKYSLNRVKLFSWKNHADTIQYHIEESLPSL